VIAWHLLTRNQPYTDLGADYFLERQHSEAYRNRLVRQLERRAQGHLGASPGRLTQSSTRATGRSTGIFNLGTFAGCVLAGPARTTSSSVA
jgi:hypothetical protein